MNIETMTELNPDQEIAVAHVEGPLLVLAGAGSGKTRVVTYRIARLLDLGILPSDILAVTFTNKAADEMRTRIRTLKNAQVLACTFHSLGARILRESISALGYNNDFTIYDQEDSEKLLKNCLNQLQILEDKSFVKKVHYQISSAKNDLIDPEEADQEYREIYQLYQQKLKECNALDFDDLLYLTVKLLKEHDSARREYQTRWLFVLIDEYQDTNLAQYTLAKTLVDGHKNIFAVGDPDQSIYSWRGARYQNILNFENDFPGAKVVTLDQNYRSTNNILQGANALIQHNGERFDKKLWSDLGEGEKVTLYIAQNERREAEFVAESILQHSMNFSYDEIAIFYRTNAQSRTFEDALLSRRIPYKIIGGLSFYQRREIKDILAYLKMVISNADLISFLRTINLPRRGLGAATLEKLVNACNDSGAPILSFCEEAIDRPDLFKLGPKQKEGLKNYLQAIHELRAKRAGLKLHELISEAISITGYQNYIQEDFETYQDRKENLDELIGKATEWQEETEEPSLPKFLEELSLRTSAEEKAHIPSIKLMTLHNSKGLEFEVVFLVGLEEDLFPHVNSKDDAKAIEEERRLCYVGMTRAKKKLYLCSTTYRYMWGTARFMKPSRFLREIPTKYIDNLSSPTLQMQEEEEEPFVSSPQGFSPGDHVIHKEFGVGVIQKAYQGSFGLTYDVLFPESATNRTLVAKFAKLQPYPT